MTRWKLLSVVICLALIVIAVPVMGACAKPTPTPSATKILKIGNTEPLATMEGLEQQKWLKLFAKLINNRGGWKIGGETYLVEIITYNDEYNAEKARTAAERLVFQDEVKYIVNQWASVAVLSTLKVTEPNKVLVIADGMTQEPMKPEYKYFIRGLGPYLRQGDHFVLISDLKERGCASAVIINPDDDTGRAGAQQASAVVLATGLKLVDSLFFPRGTSDFSPIATKIMSLNPDLVIPHTVVGESLTLLICALHDAGYKGEIYASNLYPAVLEGVISRLGQEYTEGMITDHCDVRDWQKDPEMLRYLKAYAEDYGELKQEGCQWAGSWFVFEAAVNATQSLDVDVLVNYLSNNPKAVMTLIGWNQQIARPDMGNFRTVGNVDEIHCGIVKNGKIVPYKVTTVKDQYLACIKVYGWEDVYQKYWNEHGMPKFPGE